MITVETIYNDETGRYDVQCSDHGQIASWMPEPMAERFAVGHRVQHGEIEFRPAANGGCAGERPGVADVLGVAVDVPAAKIAR